MAAAGWKTYDSYKDGHSEWLEKVPSHWSEKPLKHLGFLYAGIIGKSGDDFSKEQRDGFLPFVPFVSVANFLRIPPRFEYVRATKDEAQNRVQKGDLIFLMSSETAEDIARSSLFDLEGVQPFLNSFCRGFRPDKSRLLPEFANYLLMASAYRDYFSTSGRGFTRINIKQEYILNAPIILPPVAEQAAVAAFLDEKCAKVDEAVRIKEEQIALLRERRQILIQEAVTRGLNPDAPMKDSGIDWMGQIPAHWNVRRVKHVGLISPSRTLDRVIPNDDVVVFLPMEAVLPDGTVVQDDRRKSKEIYSGFTYFRKGDVVVAKITPCFENGKGAWLCDLETDYGFGTTELHVIRPVAVNGAFLHRVLNSEAFLSIGERFMVGSAGQKRVPTAFLADFPIPLPPPSEQLEVVAYIGEEARKIDRGIAIKESQIAALKEYKSTLINAAVTGKIKVA